MSTSDYITAGSVIAGVVFSIIGHYLNNTIKKLHEVEKIAIENKSKIEIVVNENTHLSSRYDELYDVLKELTREVKNLTIAMNKKKDI